jgi:DNA-binding MarR family transcriptional regulator
LTTRSPDGPDPARAANVVGALALVLTDRITDAVEDAAAQAETGAVALSALRHVLPPDPSIDLVRQVLGLTHSGTVRLVDRLEAAGQVRRGSGHDRRTTTVSLTAAGRRAATRVTSERAGELQAALAVLTSDEQEQLADLAGRVLAGLGRDGAGGADGSVERWTCRLCDTTACGRLRGRCPVAGAHPPTWEHR